jgi:hypothetical protein
VAKKTIGGISGVLGELISPEPTATESTPKKRPSAASPEPEPTGTPDPTPTRSPQRARLGRPPGSGVRHARPKEKVTLRISSELIADYRDWSWDARCQLSELVERAMAQYLVQRP